MEHFFFEDTYLLSDIYIFLIAFMGFSARSHWNLPIITEYIIEMIDGLMGCACVRMCLLQYLTESMYSGSELNFSSIIFQSDNK